jgi:hypothetical protein
MDYNLILDDYRTIQMVYNVTGNPVYIDKNWIIVKSFDEFVYKITEDKLPINISFDHDISDFIIEDGEIKERTGYDCIKWLVDYCMDNKLKLPNCLIHSSNTVGSVNIEKYIENSKKHLGI